MNEAAYGLSCLTGFIMPPAKPLLKLQMISIKFEAEKELLFCEKYLTKCLYNSEKVNSQRDRNRNDTGLSAQLHVMISPTKLQ